MTGPRPAGLEIIDRRTVEQALDPSTLIASLAEAFVALSRGDVVAPQRVALSTEKGYSLSMPAYRPGGQLMVKVVTIFEGNKSLGLPSHQSLICLFDAGTGGPMAVIDATVITTLRTAATAALSTALLAREDARVLTIIGAGAQAEAHIKLIPLTRPLDEIRVSARCMEDAERVAALDPRARCRSVEGNGGPVERYRVAVHQRGHACAGRDVDPTGNARDVGRVPRAARRASGSAPRAGEIVRRDPACLRAATRRLLRARRAGPG